MLDWTEQFKYPDVALEYRRKKKLSISACLLYMNFCYMWYMYDKKDWFYVSTKVMLDKFNIKRSTYFNSKKQLIKFGLIKENNNHYIKIPKLLEIQQNPEKENEFIRKTIGELK